MQESHSFGHISLRASTAISRYMCSLNFDISRAWPPGIDDREQIVDIHRAILIDVRSACRWRRGARAPRIEHPEQIIDVDLRIVMRDVCWARRTVAPMRDSV